MTPKRDTVKAELKKEISLPKKIGIDILGVLLIISSALFGWLPGPGGIPLFLAGLGLLATNHEWARRILVEVKENGMKFASYVFKDHPVLVVVYDIVAIALIVGAGVIFGNANKSIVRGLMIALVFLGISLFLGNRHRINKINAFVRRITRRNSKT